jgi:hypothetical protein
MAPKNNCGAMYNFNVKVLKDGIRLARGI